MGKRKLKKKNIKPDYGQIGGILVFLLSFFTYLKTLTPDVALQDTGELISCAYLLGIPHPPGYPLYCLLGKLWMTILPIGNIAYRMNMLSALCAGLSCMMVYFIILKLAVTSKQWTVKKDFSDSPILPFSISISNLISAIVGALMLAFASTFWQQAVIAEKYTLNALFVTFVIFILLKWHEGVIGCNPKSYLYLFAFTLGLSFTHHMQTIYLIPASIFFILTECYKCRYSSLITLHSSVKLLCCFITPLFLYLYLPLRAIVNPLVNMGDPDTWKRFIEHITAEQFGGYFEISEAVGRLYTSLAQFFPHQWTIYLIWFGLIGGFFVCKYSMRLFVFLSLILITNILYSLFYNIPNIQDYYLPAFMVFAIWMGVGVQYLLLWLMKSNKKNIGIIYFLFLSLPIIPLTTNYPESNRSQYYFASDLVRNILTPMEEKSIIFLETDDTAFPLWYSHYVEQRHPKAVFIDVPFLAVHYDWYVQTWKDKYPDLAFTFEIQDMLGVKTRQLEKIRIERIYNIITNNINSYTIYKTYDFAMATNYSLIPQGVFCKVLEKDVPGEKFKKELDKNKGFLCRGVVDKRIFKDERTQSLISIYPQSYYNIGSFYYMLKMYDQAIEKFKQALEIDPGYSKARHGIEMAYKYKS
ncbi:MAG: DUF2723 domain-containing protein [bacterium]